MHRTVPLLAVTLIAIPSAQAAAAELERVSAAVSDWSRQPAVSRDGRFLAFDSGSQPLPLLPEGLARNVYLKDRVDGTLRRVSVGLGGATPDGPSLSPAVADGGIRVTFVSDATNLVAADTNAVRDVFAAAADGTVVRVSETPDGVEGDLPSHGADVSADGRMVVFSSLATNLVPSDDNGTEDVFVRDLVSGELQRVSDAPWREGNGRSRAAAISPDGRYVTFFSESDNLVPRDTNGVGDVFLKDLVTGGLERVSVAGGGRQQNRDMLLPFAQVSDVSLGGRFIAFDSDASNLVRRDTNRDTDVFVRDRLLGRTTRVSLRTGGRQADNDSFSPSVSDDGRIVAFTSFATNLGRSDVEGADVFIYDRSWRKATQLTVRLNGRPRRRENVPQLLQRPALAGNGTMAAFISTSDGLVPGDRDRAADVFARALQIPPRKR